MTLPIQRDGLALPVSDALVTLLSELFDREARSGLSLSGVHAVTFNFRDPAYSAEDGGYHPVEIRLGRQGEAFRLEYITDFSYVGHGWDVELAKEIDFDLTWGKCEVRYCPPVDLVDAASLYRAFEENFLSYWHLGVLDAQVTLETDY